MPLIMSPVKNIKKVDDKSSDGAVEGENSEGDST